MEQNKAFLLGAFLSSIIFKHIVGNIFLGLFLAFAIVKIFHQKKIVLDKALLPLSIYFFWGFLSILWTTNVLTTMIGIISTLPFIIIPFVIYQFSDFGIVDINKSIRFFSNLLLFYFVIGIINSLKIFYSSKSYECFFYHQLVSIFNNNAIYISLAVAICILWIINLSKKEKYDYYKLFFLSIYLLLLSSKNIIISTLLLAIISLIINQESLIKKIKFFSGIIFITLSLATLNNPIRKRFIDELYYNFSFIWHGQDFYSYKFSGFEIRLFQWRVMKEMLMSNYIGFFGLGLNNVNYLLDQYFSYYNLYKGYFYINFHNQFLQTLGELGFIGLTLLISIFCLSFLKCFRKKNNAELMIMLLIFVAFFTESFLCRQKGIFLFSTIYGLFSLLSRGEK